MVAVRMHEVSIPEMVELVGICRCESALDLEDRDAEDKGERKNIKENAELDDDAVLDEKPGPEYGDAVFENEEAEDLRHGLFARGDEKKSSSHCGERHGDRKLGGYSLVDVEPGGDCEAAYDHRKDDEARKREGDDRLELALGVDFAHCILKEHWHGNAFYYRVYCRDGEEAAFGDSRAVPVPEEKREGAYRKALGGYEADCVRKAPGACQCEIREEEEREDDFGEG